ncbi:hypothetical protein ACIQUB_24235, partial [Rhizobium sp. NPDC090275]|uniref:hypothetical protein n=1 Tax=Rhizobium sp. NPDC090275 TaxID=3364498 RepID=UPI003839FB31
MKDEYCLFRVIMARSAAKNAGAVIKPIWPLSDVREIPPVKTTCYKTVKKLCMGVLTCLGEGPYKPLHRTRAAALLATVTFALDFFELAAML